MAQQRRARARMNIPICLAGILLCLTMFSIYVASNLFARYQTTASSEDDARVAKFDVAVTGETQNPVFAYGTPKGNACTITVENRSEVAVRYDVIVTLDAAATGTTVQLDGRDGTVDGTTTSFADVGALPPNAGAENAANHVLSFQMNWSALNTGDWASLAGAETTGATISKSLNYTVTVNVTQVD